MDSWLRNTLGPLLLILLCPPATIIIWYTNTHLSGSLTTFFSLAEDQGFFTLLLQIWAPIFWGSKTAWFMLVTFIVIEVSFLLLLPGKMAFGPTTPKGETPIYKANGVIAFFCSLGLYLFASYYLHLFSPSIIYDEFGPLLGALNILSVIVCLLLYFKGKFAPSSKEHHQSGNFIFDYYWGIELYPMISRINIKRFITCRFGMMSWGIILIAYAAKQASTSGLSNAMVISVGLQLIYITKFFFWEIGYLNSLDIMHDRAGFYICWGCLVWVPCVYTSPSMYLVLHPIELSFLAAICIFLIGFLSIMINYGADRQRQLIRKTNGNCNVWGKPPKLLIARFKTEAGIEKESLLLASGWWGIARHFHYVPEIIAALCWSIPALFQHFMPYFYVTFLTILLLDRAFRDDKRCAKKYGNAWQTYCENVPYKIIPGVL